MTNELIGIHHVGIVVQSLDASADWYAEKLGFQRLHSFSFPGAKVVFVGLGSLRLELIEVEAGTPMAPERKERQTNIKLGGINHLAIEVADLDLTVTALQEKGVEIASLPSEVPGSGGSRFAFIRDNEGMLVELIKPAS